MATAAEMLSQGLREEVWRKYCGFLDLSMNKFMEIQERLFNGTNRPAQPVQVGSELFW